MDEPTPQLRERLFYFRRRFSATHRPVRALLQVAPWVNVVLLLLLFFMVNSSYVVQPGVRLQLPLAPFTDGARYGSLVVTIPQEGMFFFADQRLTLDGLASELQKAGREQPDTSLVIEADRRVSHGTLVQVYHMALGAGLRDVLWATRSPTPP